MNAAARMGSWSARHRKKAIVGWLLLVVAAMLIGSAAGTKQITDAEGANGQSAKAERVLAASGFARSASENVLVQTRNGKPDDAALRAAISQVVSGVKATGAVHDVHSALDADGTPFVSADGHSMLVAFDMTGDPDTASSRVQPILDAVAKVQQANPALRVEEVGDASSSAALDKTLGNDFKRAELLSIPLTLGILLAVFGALVAAIVPIGLAITAFMAAGGLLALTSRAVHINGTANSVMLLVGLAVGVDYTLFYLKREREERARGRSAADALRIAAATSGRSVLVSGLTVVAAVSGLFLTGDATFKGVAEATVLVVAIAVIGSVTVLPALMSWLGDRIEKGRVPLLHRLRRADGESRVWRAVLRGVLARPRRSAVIAAGLLAALAVPLIGMRTALPGNTDLPKNLPIVQAYDRMSTAFPGGPAPADVVISAPSVTTPAMTAALRALSDEAAATGEMSAALETRFNPAGTVAEVSIPLAGNGSDAASNHALKTLRNTVVPNTIGKIPGAHAYVTGQTAGSKDFGQQLAQRAPFVFAFVLGLAFLLLLGAFRSLTVALTAIVLNLLSIGASYGVMVLVFQHHWFDGVLGYTSTGTIATWIPLFMFAILFGLSMDYHVFILSRVVENRRRGMSTKDAVEHGIAATAGVITSAAVIMVAVFAVFGTLSQVSMKQVGVGLAAAVLLDATIVRAVLLPAVMALLGERNWYLPRWLQWLPGLPIEGVESSPSEIALPRAREEIARV
ncbi:MAG: putative drug exporter of the superfamily [Actinomycetota bacterium]|nr:putative drug exporter of the superfamily [Actinomycetota bacterium]